MEEQTRALSDVIKAHHQVMPAIATLVRIVARQRIAPTGLAGQTSEIDEATAVVLAAAEEMRMAVYRYNRLALHGVESAPSKRRSCEFGEPIAVAMDRRPSHDLRVVDYKEPMLRAIGIAVSS